LNATAPQTKKRIAILIDSLYGGGAEKVMLTLASALTEIGHNACIIALSKHIDYDVPATCDIHFLYEKKVRLKGYINGLKHAKNLKNLVENIESQNGRFDLILANLEETYRIAANCNFGPIYYVIHNSIIETLNRTKRLGPYKYFYLKAILHKLKDKDLITVSKGIKKELQETQVIKARSITVINNPYNFSEIRKLSLEQNNNIQKTPYIVHIARAGRQKRHDVLFAALKNINADYKLVCLTRDIKKLRALAASIGVSERVIFPGFQQNPYPWIRQASAMILSSDYEGFSNVLIEAIICGTIPVSTNCPHGPNEILTGSLEKFLADRRNPEQLAEKVNLAVKVQLSDLQYDSIQMVDHIYAAKRYLDLIE